MTEAEKMADDLGFLGDAVDIVGIIKEVAERTREECERASTFVLAAHPRWSNLVADEIDRAIWEDDEYTPD